MSRITTFAAMLVMTVSCGRVFAEEQPLAPGSCLAKREEIRKLIKSAEAHHIGVKPYHDALAAIEEDVKAGKTEPEIEPRLVRLKASLYAQFSDYRKLKSGVLPATIGKTAASRTGAVSNELKGTTSSRVLPETELENAMLSLVNDERKKVGASSLSASARLAQLAKAHSADMLKRNYFSHNNPEGQGPVERAYAAGITGVEVYENVATTPSRGAAIVTVSQAHHDLMASPGHRANILEPKHKVVGIGICYDPTYGIRVTQLFADSSI